MVFPKNKTWFGFDVVGQFDSMEEEEFAIK